VNPIAAMLLGCCFAMTTQAEQPQTAYSFISGDDLFDALRIRRKRLADAEGVPPYVIFGDATLAEMAAKMPTDEEKMMAINGVGKHKLRRFGSEFIDEIMGYMCR